MKEISEYSLYDQKKQFDYVNLDFRVLSFHF